MNPGDPSDDLFKLCSLNTRPLKNKAGYFVSCAINSKADLLALTEAWFTDMDVAHKVEATPPGFRLLYHPRKKHVGEALLCCFVII